jgi:hypothetical protein
MQNPDVWEAVSLWRTCEGRTGIDGQTQLAPMAIEALAVIDEARAARLEEEAEQARAARR